MRVFACFLVIASLVTVARADDEPFELRASQVTNAVQSLPAATKALDKLADAQAPCVPIVMLEGAAFDVLPLELKASKQKDAAKTFGSWTRLELPSARQALIDQLHSWFDADVGPTCDRAPGQNCDGNKGPRAQATTSTATLRSALGLSLSPQRRSANAAFAARAVASIYAEAIKNKTPGAKAAADRLAAKLRALAKSSRNCSNAFTSR